MTRILTKAGLALSTALLMASAATTATAHTGPDGAPVQASERAKSSSVTIEASRETTLTATPVTYSGTVAPRSQVNLILQTKTESGKWTTVATGHTTRKGSYTITYRPNTPGEFITRVAVVGNGTRSINLPLSVERWYNITDLTRIEGCGKDECYFREEKVADVKYPRGIFFQDPNLNGAVLTYETEGCSAYKGATGFSDYAVRGDGQVMVLVDGTMKFSAEVVDHQAALPISLNIEGSKSLTLDFEPGADGAVFVNSQVRCAR